MASNQVRGTNILVAAPREAEQESDIEVLMEKKETANLLRFSTAGSVDDGKSTLIGRLLHDSKNIFQDQLLSLPGDLEGDDGAVDFTANKGSLALVTDGLKAEKEQGITIDVAYRYFATPNRRFILADTPGHEQYTRNMATGSSNSELAIILIDARKGLTSQTKRHLFIASLLGVPSFLVAVNKMDLVDYSEKIFDNIKEEFLSFAEKLAIKGFTTIPISALEGDNVVIRSSQMPWYDGETVLEHLENVEVNRDLNKSSFRFPVQYTIFSGQDYRGYAGQIASGIIHVGDEVTALPSFKKSRIKSIDVCSPGVGQLCSILAHAPMSVSLTLTEELDVGRGDMLVRTEDLPTPSSHVEAMVVWMDDQPLDTNQSYILMHTTRETKAYIHEVQYKLDVDNLSSQPVGEFKTNDIGRVSLKLTNSIFYDPYNKNRATGSFILVDSETYKTAAAGMIVDPLDDAVVGQAERKQLLKERPQISKNIHRERSSIEGRERERRAGHRAATLWFTGLSGSGKSSIAKSLERSLFKEDVNVYRLDGDNLRFGLNRDLGFSEADRIENIRRAAEVARLFNEAGVMVLCAFISPFARDREAAREIIGRDRFVEIYVNAPLKTCESRDPHGLYRRARAGEIKEFTGVSSPYEAPESPEITVDTTKKSLDECVQDVRDQIQGMLKPPYLG